MPRAAALALAAVLAGFAGGVGPGLPAARAEEPGFALYESAAKKILRSAGAKVWEAAEDARRSGFHQFAIEQAERAIGFDPDQKEAREFLRYAKRDGRWVRDEEAWNSPGVPKQNQRAASQGGAQESQESFDKRVEKWREESLQKADRFVAARYADLGDECASKGHLDQAKKGWEASLRLDPDNAKARKGLGYKRLGKTWLTAKQEQARKDAAKGTVVAEGSRWDEFFGTKLNKVESAHFRIESPYAVEELMGYVAAIETAYAYYLTDFGMDPSVDVFGGGRLTFVVMQTDDQWNKFVDAYGGADKEFTRQMSGTGDGNLLRGTASKQGSTVRGRTDQLVHQTVHSLNQFHWKVGHAAWIDEGLAYYYTLKVLETTSTFCVSLKKGNYVKPGNDGGIKEWGDAANWKPKIKELVLAKNDVPLRTLVNQPITQLQFDATVKAWCVVTWLMESDRDKFMQVLSQVGEQTKSEIVLQGLYEKGLEELDDAFHEHVRRTY
jgi:tetratricopeptide (TPR) repeat protein